MRRSTAVTAIFSILTTPLANAKIMLDKLSSCDDVASIVQVLALGVPPSSDCRQAQGILEKKIASQLDPVGPDRFCFMAEDPAPFTDGFRCIYTELTDGYPTISCYRYISVSDITEYRQQYFGSESRNVNEYLLQASKCSISDGISGIAPPTLLNGSPLEIVAQFELGFVLGVGAKGLAEKYILHGVASLDPRVAPQGLGAIELIYIMKGKLQ